MNMTQFVVFVENTAEAQIISYVTNVQLNDSVACCTVFVNKDISMCISALIADDCQIKFLFFVSFS